MKRICAWHPENFGHELVMERGTEPATYGICPECYERAVQAASRFDWRAER